LPQKDPYLSTGGDENAPWFGIFARIRVGLSQNRYKASCNHYTKGGV